MVSKIVFVAVFILQGHQFHNIIVQHIRCVYKVFIPYLVYQEGQPESSE